MKQAILGTLGVAAFFIPALLMAQTVTGDMNVSLRVIIVPAAPINLTATSTSYSRIDVQWEDTSSNETGFKIERKTGMGGTYSEIDSVGTGQTEYASTELTHGTTYYFRVRAFNNDGPSGYTNEASSTTPGEPPVPQPPSNGSVGGVGSPNISPASHESEGGNDDEDITVKISGHAYPKIVVRILVDGEEGGSTISKDDASFMALVSAKPGVRTFSVYAVDGNGRRSPVSTFSLSLQSGTVASASDIFLAPFINTDKSEVKRGDELTITGQSAPSSTITLTVSEGRVEKEEEHATTDASGRYTFSFDTKKLSKGSYSIKSSASLSDSEKSSKSHLVVFKVGDRTVKNTATIGRASNNANMVNFSVLLYNWGNAASSALATSDFNKDGKINLVDMSILLYRWVK